MKPDKKRIIRRILVALDASPHSLAALEAAVALAEKLNAELIGLFVEDINLLRYSEMPFAREMGHYSASPRNLDTGQLERQFRTQAEWARQALIQAATQASLPCHLKVVRGSIPSELIAATEEADLIILGQKGWTDLNKVGSTAQTIMTEAETITLILREGSRLGGSVMTIFDGSPSADEALDVAGDLVQGGEGKLVVLIIAEDPDHARAFMDFVSGWSEQRKQLVYFRWLKNADPYMVCSIAQTEGSGILVLPKDSQSLTNEMVLAILSDVNCPVMFVRQTSPEAAE